MAFIQSELDRMIMNRNKNESYMSPLKYNPSFQNDNNFKPKLHGNKDISSSPFTKSNVQKVTQENYYDIQHEYINGHKETEDQSMKNLFNKNIRSPLKQQGNNVIKPISISQNHEYMPSDYKPQYSNYNVISSNSNDINKKIDTEYSKYKKYYNADRGVDEYNQNKISGYGRNIISSPNKDYSQYFKK